ncbi:MAG: hypothetical protein EOO01_29215, partial [Chitinophagaceae bacterium]
SRAYLDTCLFDAAIALANKDPYVIQATGPLSSLDKLAIFEGSTMYSKDKQQVTSTVRVSGDKAGGKMDFVAKKENGDWEFEMIKLRLKSGKVIRIVK